MKKSLFILPIVICIIISCQDKKVVADLEEYRNMETVLEQNKEIVRQVFASIDSNNFENLNELFSNDFGLMAPGLEISWKLDDVSQAIEKHYTSFPDWTHNIEEMIAEGDKVAVKLIQIGTHQEMYEGISATGKRITNPAMSIMTIVDGKVKDWWVIEDNLGFMQQLGMELQMKD